jgi:cbb3-type cytochrome oxidase subunit 3
MHVIGLLSTLTMIILAIVAWRYRQKARRHRQCAKYARTVLGISDASEAEETVALLSLGIQNQFFPQIPGLPPVAAHLPGTMKSKYGHRLSKL